METIDRRMIYKIAFLLDVRDIVQLFQCNKLLWRYFNDEPTTPYGMDGEILALDYISNQFWMEKGIQLGIFRRYMFNIGNARIRCIGWAKNAKRHLHAQTESSKKREKIKALTEAQAIRKAQKCKKAFKTYRAYEKDVAEHLGAYLEGDNYVRPVDMRIPGLTSIFDPRLGADEEEGSISVARFNNMNENREMLEEDYDDVIYQEYEEWNKKSKYQLSKQQEWATTWEFKKKRFADKIKLGPINDVDLNYEWTHLEAFHLAAIDLHAYHVQKSQIIIPTDGVWYTAQVLPKK